MNEPEPPPPPPEPEGPPHGGHRPPWMEPGHVPPWMWRRRFARRRRAGVFLPILVAAIAFAARRAARPRRPEVSVFVGVMFRPTISTDVTLFGISGRRHRRGRGRLFGRHR